MKKKGITLASAILVTCGIGSWFDGNVMQPSENGTWMVVGALASSVYLELACVLAAISLLLLLFRWRKPIARLPGSVVCVYRGAFREGQSPHLAALVSILIIANLLLPFALAPRMWRDAFYLVAGKEIYRKSIAAAMRGEAFRRSETGDLYAASNVFNAVHRVSGEDLDLSTAESYVELGTAQDALLELASQVSFDAPIGKQFRKCIAELPEKRQAEASRRRSALARSQLDQIREIGAGIRSDDMRKVLSALRRAERDGIGLSFGNALQRDVTHHIRFPAEPCGPFLEFARAHVDRFSSHPAVMLTETNFQELVWFVDDALLDPASRIGLLYDVPEATLQTVPADAISYQGIPPWRVLAAGGVDELTGISEKGSCRIIVWDDGDKPAIEPPLPGGKSVPSDANDKVIRSVTIDELTSFEAFAERHHMSVDLLNKLNGLSLEGSTILAPGSELYVSKRPRGPAGRAGPR